MDSDVDLVVLTTNTDKYLSSADWISRTIPGSRLVGRRQFGMVDERRVGLLSGLQVEVGITTPTWATAGHRDEGTAEVVRNGLRVVYDPGGLLRTLVANVRQEQGGGRVLVTRFAVSLAL
jgi:uncharacterized protein